MRVAWQIAAGALILGVGACISFPPGDICGYAGFCGDGGSTTEGGSEGGIDAPPGCDLTVEPKDSPACVADSVGVFVSTTGKPTGAGTKADPVDTITTALSKLGAKPRIYVCNGDYADSSVVAVPVGIYGGFACASWSYEMGKRPRITGTKPAYTMKLDSVTGVTVTDLELHGKDGAPNSGESSVALFSNQTTATLLRVDLYGGAGAKGVDGAANVGYTFPMASALKGHDAQGMDGGTDNKVTCPAGDMTMGGGGGNNGFAGTSGLPALGGGQGGSGTDCATGSTGKNGTAAPAATDGKGGGSVALGKLDAQGWTPDKGEDGPNGTPGQGGGGGAGFSGGGGGGGGAGGCGGKGGNGGAGGGASIGVIANGGVLTLKSLAVKSTTAGAGGAGTDGQPGQSPGGGSGLPYMLPNQGCAGGGGGAGGKGGAGGGGAGGLAVAMVYKGARPTTMQVTLTGGTAGMGGAGGGANKGKDGIADMELMVP